MKSLCYFKAGSYFVIIRVAHLLHYFISFRALSKLLTYFSDSMKIISFQFCSCLTSLTVTLQCSWFGQKACEKKWQKMEEHFYCWVASNMPILRWNLDNRIQKHWLRITSGMLGMISTLLLGRRYTWKTADLYAVHVIKEHAMSWDM